MVDPQLAAFDPKHHELTQVLIAQMPAFQQNLPARIAACEKDVESGLILLTVVEDIEQVGNQRWIVVIGGESFPFGDEEGATPVGVRFRDPVSLAGVDDTGFVHCLFEKPVPEGGKVSLPWLAASLVDLLDGRLHDGSEQSRRFFASAAKTRNKKLETIQVYRNQYALSAEIVSPCATLKPEWLAEGLRDRLFGGGGGDWRSLVEQLSPGVFSFQIFTNEFCDALVAEFDAYESSPLPRRRPNTMNNFGLVVNETGWLAVMNDILRRVVRPLASECFGTSEPFVGMGAGLDCHHSFVVQYRAACEGEAGDEGLDMHVDASEVTLNVGIGKGDFNYSGLVFCGQAGRSDVRRHQASIVQRKGQAIIHLGRHRHGAGKISKGERLNLIMWARNSTFRAAAGAGVVLPDGFPREKEEGGIDRVCLSAANDSDFVERIAASL